MEYLHRLVIHYVAFIIAKHLIMRYNLNKHLHFLNSFILLFKNFRKQFNLNFIFNHHFNFTEHYFITQTIKKPSFPIAPQSISHTISRDSISSSPFTTKLYHFSSTYIYCLCTYIHIINNMIMIIIIYNNTKKTIQAKIKTKKNKIK